MAKPTRNWVVSPFPQPHVSLESDAVMDSNVDRSVLQNLGTMSSAKPYKYDIV